MLVTTIVVLSRANWPLAARMASIHIPIVMSILCWVSARSHHFIKGSQTLIPFHHFLQSSRQENVNRHPCLCVYAPQTCPVSPRPSLGLVPPDTTVRARPAGTGRTTTAARATQQQQQQHLPSYSAPAAPHLFMYNLWDNLYHYRFSGPTDTAPECSWPRCTRRAIYYCHRWVTRTMLMTVWTHAVISWCGCAIWCGAVVGPCLARSTPCIAPATTSWLTGKQLGPPLSMVLAPIARCTRFSLST